MKNRSVSINAGGGGSLLSGCEAPAPVRASETGRARNWTMPPLRLERECKERTNSATIDNRCVEFDRRENQRCAFTMAEILLSLTIIGVVAAITLPSLTGNINERTWNTQRKALYARFSQAISLMPALNGYGTYIEGDSSTSAVDTAAETFITAGLAKVLKINNICDSEHLQDCGLTSKLTTLTGSVDSLKDGFRSFNVFLSLDNTKAAAFETQNGESIVTYYNPKCTSYMGETIFYVSEKLCVNFLYDLNGTKGPNTIGKDMGFISVLYPTDSVVVAPMPAIQQAGSGHSGNVINQSDASKYCRAQGDDYRLPNKEEAGAMAVNRWLIGGYYSTAWTSSLYEVRTKPWFIYFNESRLAVHNSTTDSGTADVICIKRY